MRGLGADVVAGAAVVVAAGADVVAGAAEVASVKMSTALERPLLAAQGMRLVHAITKQTSAHSTIPFPNQNNTTRKDSKINMATRTTATSEDRDSQIRQRCGCKTTSSYAEICSAPSSRRHVEDVHGVGEAAVNCARHETCTRNKQTNPRPLNHPIPKPAQHKTRRCENQHGKILATRTIATSEDRDSMIRQRCGYKPHSSYAESCSAPSSQRVGCRNLLSRVCCGHTAGEQHGSCSRSGSIMSLPPLHALGCRARF